MLSKADGIIFPGVGAAGQAMDELTSEGLDEVLKSLIWQEKPLLGICVGCQILLDYCEENNTPRSPSFPRMQALQPAWTEPDGTPIRVPHMGWNRVALKKDCPLFKGIPDEAEFYFVHSYHPAPKPDFIIAETNYGEDFCSVHGRPGLWAVQFHPEKSGAPGLKLLSNFHEYCLEAKNAQ